MRGGVARRRSGGVDAATALLRDDDSRPSNVSGNFTLHVLVASDSDGACGQEACDTAGENVTATKHGFESRWGHHGDFVLIFAPKSSSPGGRDVNPSFTPRRCRTSPTPAG